MFSFETDSIVAQPPTFKKSMMLIKPYLSRLLAIILVATIALVGCGGSPSGLTGNYTQDTLKVIETLSEAIALPNDTPDLATIQAQAREQIKEYISQYRRNTSSGGLRSFTTMQTALNSLAGYYTAYGARPLPEKLKKRLQQEFKQAEIAVQRGI